MPERMVFCCRLFLGCFIFCLFAGCAHIEETAKVIWGSSITHLEKERPNGKSQVFALSLEKCFEETDKIIVYHGGFVYLKDQKERYMAAMNFKGFVDTTEVGVFFTALDNNQTQVDVASMSPKLVRRVAEFVFSGLQKTEAILKKRREDAQKD